MLQLSSCTGTLYARNQSSQTSQLSELPEIVLYLDILNGAHSRVFSHSEINGDFINVELCVYVQYSIMHDALESLPEAVNPFISLIMASELLIALSTASKLCVCSVI